MAKTKEARLDSDENDENIKIISDSVSELPLKVIKVAMDKIDVKFSDINTDHLDHLSLIKEVKNKVPPWKFKEFVKNLKFQKSNMISQGQLQVLGAASRNTIKLPAHEIDGNILFLTFIEINQQKVPMMACLPDGEDELVFLEIKNKYEDEKNKIMLDSQITQYERKRLLQELDFKDVNYSYFNWCGEEIPVNKPLKAKEFSVSIHFPEFSKLKQEVIKDRGELFDKIEKLVYRFFDHSVSKNYPVIATFPIISFVCYFLGWSPYLFLTSKSGGRGKSNILRLLTHLSYNGAYFSAGSTIRGVVRLIHKYKCSIAFDEIDKNSDDIKKEISGILNNGSEDAEGGYIVTNTNSDVGEDVLVFDCFSTKYLAGNSLYGIAYSTLSRTKLIECTKANRNIERLTGATANKLEDEFNLIRCSILYQVLKHKDTLVSLVNTKIVELKEKYRNNDRGVETVALIVAIIEFFKGEEEAKEIEKFQIQQMIINTDEVINEKDDAIIRAFLDNIIEGKVTIDQEGLVEIPSKWMREKANERLEQDSKIKKRSRRISKLFKSLNCLELKKIMKVNGKFLNGYKIDVRQFWKSLERENLYAEVVADYEKYFDGEGSNLRVLNENSNLEPEPQKPQNPDEMDIAIEEAFVDDSDEGSEDSEEDINPEDYEFKHTPESLREDYKKIKECLLSELKEKDSMTLSEFIFEHNDEFLIKDIEAVVKELKKQGDIFEPQPNTLKLL